MKINLKQLSCSSHGVFTPGIRDVPEDLGLSLIEAGLAEEVKEPAEELKEQAGEQVLEPVETRVVAPKRTAATRKK
jgi:hypothetical protein